MEFIFGKRIELERWRTKNTCKSWCEIVAFGYVSISSENMRTYGKYYAESGSN